MLISETSGSRAAIGKMSAAAATPSISKRGSRPAIPPGVGCPYGRDPPPKCECVAPIEDLLLNVTALSFNGDGFDCVQGRLKQEVKGRRQWLDGGSLAHAPESYKSKELIRHISLLRKKFA